jgi:hypothetical protein
MRSSAPIIAGAYIQQRWAAEGGCWSTSKTATA